MKSTSAALSCMPPPNHPTQSNETYAGFLQNVRTSRDEAVVSFRRVFDEGRRIRRNCLLLNGEDARPESPDLVQLNFTLAHASRNRLEKVTSIARHHAKSRP